MKVSSIALITSVFVGMPASAVAFAISTPAYSNQAPASEKKSVASASAEISVAASVLILVWLSFSVYSMTAWDDEHAIAIGDGRSAYVGGRLTKVQEVFHCVDVCVSRGV